MPDRKRRTREQSLQIEVNVTKPEIRNPRVLKEKKKKSILTIP